MITQTIDLNLVPGSVCPVIHLNQFDKYTNGLKFNLYQDALFTIPSGSSVTIRGTKPDGYGFDYTAASWSGNTATFNVTEQMTAVDGDVPCELRVVNGTKLIGTQNFILAIERAPLNDDTVISDSDIPAIAAAADYAAEAASSAAQAAITLSSAVKYSDIVNNGTYTGAAGQKALDAKMGKTLADSIDTKADASAGTSINPTLKFGVGSNGGGSTNPHIELRRSGGSGIYGLSVVYYDENGDTSSALIVDSNGGLFPTLAPKNHATTATTYGAGTASNYGHVKLSDTYTSSGGAAANSVAASSKALADAFAAIGSSIQYFQLTSSGTDSSTTFTMGENIGFLMGKRGSDYFLGMATYWDGSVTIIASNGTIPTITKSANSKTITVNNSNRSNAMPVLFITNIT